MTSTGEERTVMATAETGNEENAAGARKRKADLCSAKQVGSKRKKGDEATKMRRRRRGRRKKREMVDRGGDGEKKAPNAPRNTTQFLMEDHDDTVQYLDGKLVGPKEEEPRSSTADVTRRKVNCGCANTLGLSHAFMPLLFCCVTGAAVEGAQPVAGLLLLLRRQQRRLHEPRVPEGVQPLPLRPPGVHEQGGAGGRVPADGGARGGAGEAGGGGRGHPEEEGGQAGGGGGQGGGHAGEMRRLRCENDRLHRENLRMRRGGGQQQKEQLIIREEGAPTTSERSSSSSSSSSDSSGSSSSSDSSSDEEEECAESREEEPSSAEQNGDRESRNVVTSTSS